ADSFSRDEWAYLITFTSPSALRACFERTFGPQVPAAEQGPLAALKRPRGEAAVWLPNNVSMLGPLTVILCLLAGLSVKVKAGSRSVNLVAVLRDWLLDRLEPGPLRRAWEESMDTVAFGRDDPRHHDWAASAAVRLV